MQTDRDTIGLTPESQIALDTLDARKWFADGQDAARFSLAYAIKAKVGAGNTQGTDTRWSVGNFDKTGEMRPLVTALYPGTETPVRLMEHLVNEGLRRIAARLSDSLGPADLAD